jgi:hypothetical protein
MKGIVGREVFKKILSIPCPERSTIPVFASMSANSLLRGMLGVVSRLSIKSYTSGLMPASR